MSTQNLDRITIEPGKMGGRPCIRGHRFTVEQLLSMVGAGWTVEQIREEFPFIEPDDVRQAVAANDACVPSIRVDATASRRR